MARVSGRAAETFYAIRIGSFKTLESALLEVKRAREFSDRAFYRHSPVAGKGAWYRVYVGKFKTKDGARREARRLLKMGRIKDYFLNPIVEKEPEKGARDIVRKTVEGQQKVLESPEKAELPLVIEAIKLDLDPGEKETLQIKANRYFSPAVHFSLNRNPPQLVVVILDLTSFNQSLCPDASGAKTIEDLDCRWEPGEQRLSLVVRLHAPGDARFGQSFVQGKNLYLLDILPGSDD